MEEQEPIIGGPAIEDGQPIEQAAALVERLKAALAGTLPGLEPTLITGESAEEIEASFAMLREAIASSRPVVAVPAGAPGRVSPLPQSAFGKIREGLARLER